MLLCPFVFPPQLSLRTSVESCVALTPVLNALVLTCKTFSTFGPPCANVTKHQASFSSNRCIMNMCGSAFSSSNLYAFRSRWTQIWTNIGARKYTGSKLSSLRRRSQRDNASEKAELATAAVGSGPVRHGLMDRENPGTESQLSD